MVEVGLDGVPPSRPGVFIVLAAAPETVGEFRLAAVRDVGDAPGDAEPGVRPLTGRRVVVVAAAPAWVGPDGVDLRSGPGDLLGRRRGVAGQEQQGGYPAWVADRPFQGL